MNIINSLNIRLHAKLWNYLISIQIVNREKARFHADELQIALEESKINREKTDEELAESQKQIVLLTETNDRLVKQNEADKNAASQLQDETKRMAEDRQSQITVLMEEKKQRDAIVNELTQTNSQLKEQNETEKNEGSQLLDELKKKLDSNHNEIQILLEAKKERDAFVEELTETNSQLVKQNEADKKAALQLNDEMKKVMEDKQGQITVLLEEKKERDLVFNELTQKMQELQSEFTVQRTKLEEQLQKTLQEANVVEQLQQEL